MRRALAAVLVILLLGFAALRFLPGLSDPPADDPPPVPERIGFYHGFYAFSSFNQLDLACEMDAVSLCWAHMELDAGGSLQVSETASATNSFARPAGSDLVLGELDKHAVPYNLCVFGGGSALAAVLESEENRARTVSLLVDAAAGYAGLTVDFEGLRSASRESFTALMTALRGALPAEQTLYVCVQPDTWFGGYDYRALGRVCDKVILMAHDYQWTSVPESRLGTTDTDTPVAPLGSVRAALTSLLDPETGLEDPRKAVLALAVVSAGLEVDGEGRLLSKTIYHPGPSTIVKRLRQSDSVRVYSERHENPCLTYVTEEGMRCLLWYEDAESFTAKVRAALELGVDGISLWRLGVIPDYDDPGLFYDVRGALDALR